MDQAKIFRNGWLVQLATTGNLIATVRIYAFHELKCGPLPLLYDVQEMWPAINERVENNLRTEMIKLRGDTTEQERLKKYVASPPISGACYIYTDKRDFREFLQATLVLFGETPNTARHRAARWVIRSHHRNIPAKDSL